MTKQYQQLSNLHYQYICSIYYKLLCLQYLQNLSSVFCHPSSGIADYPTLSDETFTYDALGNRITDSNTGITQWLYNQNNQLLNSVNNQFTYDANGSQIEEKDASGQLLKQYIYNTENRLAEIKDGSGVNIATYYYDPFGRRLSKTITNPDTTTTKTYFHYNDEGYSAEKTGNQITSYLFSPQNTWSTSPILKRENNTYYYYQNDHLGTPSILHDKQGTVVNAREMKAFGEWESSVNSISNGFAFAGQYKDAETSTYYNFHRDYHPNLGRYIESDPIGLGGGINLYAYAGNNSIIAIDFLGLCWTKICHRWGYVTSIKRITCIKWTWKKCENGKDGDCVEICNRKYRICIEGLVWFDHFSNILGSRHIKPIGGIIDKYKEDTRRVCKKVHKNCIENCDECKWVGP